MMNNYNAKEKFKSFELSSHYLRVDDQHPLELLIGLNDQGQKTIRFVGNFERVKIRGTKTIDVKHLSYGEHLVLSFSLINKDYEDLFMLFCNDIIDSSRNISQNDGYLFLINKFDKWRTFGASSRNYLSEKEVKGLIGELLFLKNFLFPKYGVTTSIEGWTGTEPLKKDYSFSDSWYEIKVSTNDIVTITSFEQLESDSKGFLVVYTMEKLSPEANEISLNKLFDQINLIIESNLDRSSFLMKLVNLGYYREDYYDAFMYRISKVDLFEVDSSFPVLRRKTVPSEIANVRYDLYVNMLEKFRRDNL